MLNGAVGAALVTWRNHRTVRYEFTYNIIANIDTYIIDYVLVALVIRCMEREHKMNKIRSFSHITSLGGKAY